MDETTEYIGEITEALNAVKQQGVERLRALASQNPPQGLPAGARDAMSASLEWLAQNLDCQVEHFGTFAERILPVEKGAFAAVGA